jgi:TonB family protein
VSCLFHGLRFTDYKFCNAEASFSEREQQVKAPVNFMRSLAVGFIIMAFCGCGGNKSLTTNRAPLQAVSLDESPQPVGGLPALIAAIRYPEEAAKKNLEGVATVAVLVDATGRVEETRIAKTSGHGVLDDEALIAVARVRWQAGRKDGQAVSSWTTVPVEFKAESDY